MIFIVGFAKKVLIANPLGHVADAAFNTAGPLPLDAWTGVVAYAFQIYFDFCGYSDMAVGLAALLGFELPRNFDAPYRSENITEFWRRWHISLSSVLRDYLYLPLGGNRLGPGRTYFNLAVVMLLGGLWHGAKWNFVVWGAYHGILLAAERWRGKQSLYGFLPYPARVTLTFLITLISWVLFRADNLGAAADYLGSMFGFTPVADASPLLAATLYTPYRLLVLAIAAILIFQPRQAHDWAHAPVTWPRMVGLAGLFAFALVTLYSQTFNPFLYFQF